MPLVTLGLPNHDTIPGVSANDHHTPTVAGDLNLNDLAEKLHASLAGVGVSDHHVKTVAGELALAGLAEKLHASLTGVGADDHHAELHIEGKTIAITTTAGGSATWATAFTGTPVVADTMQRATTSNISQYATSISTTAVTIKPEANLTYTANVLAIEAT